MASRTYQLAAEPNATNADDETNNSHAIVRRLTAEQMLDSISAVLATPLPLEGAPAGTRLAQLAEGRKHYKPLDRRTSIASPRASASRRGSSRRTASAATRPRCRRSSSSSAARSSSRCSRESGNVLGGAHRSGEAGRGGGRELFWTALSRPPSEAERARSTAHLAGAGDRRRALEDLAWALVNSKEFVFRQ